MKTSYLIIHLIHEELRNKRLMHSLEDLGFDCSAFTLNISQEILELSGFKERSDELYEWYFKLIDKALEEITFWNMEDTLEKWAMDIHKELKRKKRLFPLIGVNVQS